MALGTGSVPVPGCGPCCWRCAGADPRAAHQCGQQHHLQFPPSPRAAPFRLQKNTQKATEDPELLAQPLRGRDVQLPSVRMGQRGNTSLPLKQGKTSLAPPDLQHPTGHRDARPAPGQPLVRMGSMARHPSATVLPAARCTGALTSPQLRGQDAELLRYTPCPLPRSLGCRHCSARAADGLLRAPGASFSIEKVE